MVAHTVEAVVLVEVYVGSVCFTPAPLGTLLGQVKAAETANKLHTNNQIFFIFGAKGWCLLAPLFLMFRILIIGLLIGGVSNLAMAQNKELYVKYDFYFKDYFPENRHIEVLANRHEALSTIERTIMYRKAKESVAEPRSTYVNLYRKNDTIRYKEEINEDHYYFVKEPMGQKFQWTLTGNTKRILEYNCQEATTTFEGRDYVAYFTTALPFKAAPWKFYGLPGVTLSVETVDKRIKMEAYSVAVRNRTGDLTNPFAAVTEFISWDEFKVLYIDDWKAFKRKFTSHRSSIGNNSSMGRPSISPGLHMEVIVEGN